MVNIGEEIAQGKIYARFVLEILGAPKEHVEKSMGLLTKSLKEQDGIQIIKENPAEAVPQDQLFSIYTEFEAMFKNFDTVVAMFFDFMPSSLEILEPSNFKLKSTDMSNFFNDLLGRMHEVDMRLKDHNAENIILRKNASNLLRNIILLILKDGNKNIEEVSRQTGIKPDQLEPFMSAFVEQKTIKKEGDKYAIIT